MYDWSVKEKQKYTSKINQQALKGLGNSSYIPLNVAESLEKRLTSTENLPKIHVCRYPHFMFNWFFT